MEHPRFIHAQLHQYRHTAIQESPSEVDIQQWYGDLSRVNKLRVKDQAGHNRSKIRRASYQWKELACNWQNDFAIAVFCLLVRTCFKKLNSVKAGTSVVHQYSARPCVPVLIRLQETACYQALYGEKRYD
jgi:hypothetical protein